MASHAFSLLLVLFSHDLPDVISPCEEKLTNAQSSRVFSGLLPTPWCWRPITRFCLFFFFSSAQSKLFSLKVTRVDFGSCLQPLKKNIPLFFLISIIILPSERQRKKGTLKAILPITSVLKETQPHTPSERQLRSLSQAG